MCKISTTIFACEHEERKMKHCEAFKEDKASTSLWMRLVSPRCRSCEDTVNLFHSTSEHCLRAECKLKAKVGTTPAKEAERSDLPTPKPPPPPAPILSRINNTQRTIRTQAPTADTRRQGTYLNPTRSSNQKGSDRPPVRAQPLTKTSVSTTKQSSRAPARQTLRPVGNSQPRDYQSPATRTRKREPTATNTPTLKRSDAHRVQHGQDGMCHLPIIGKQDLNMAMDKRKGTVPVYDITERRPLHVRQSRQAVIEDASRLPAPVQVVGAKRQAVIRKPLHTQSQHGLIEGIGSPLSPQGPPPRRPLPPIPKTNRENRRSRLPLPAPPRAPQHPRPAPVKPPTPATPASQRPPPPPLPPKRYQQNSPPKLSLFPRQAGEAPGIFSAPLPSQRAALAAQPPLLRPVRPTAPVPPRPRSHTYGVDKYVPNPAFAQRPKPKKEKKGSWFSRLIGKSDHRDRDHADDDSDSDSDGMDFKCVGDPRGEHYLDAGHQRTSKQ
ncbi:hypothetical protein B0H66DRAFT_527793 [Apodospora peruviana]|uniref:Uncharacterized protein n=1 Tax=Apodospora peruviana TaxID=516989 RepID=A0AAE0MFD2_9PEZI|nr:hypothetical protein B0H66DRAFT_527793 [Apodospora peruviana]